MISNYLCKKQVLRGTFGEICRIQIQISPQTSVQLKYDVSNLKTKTVPIVIQQSCRIVPPPLGIGNLFSDSALPDSYLQSQIGYYHQLAILSPIGYNIPKWISNPQLGVNNTIEDWGFLSQINETKGANPQSPII